MSPASRHLGLAPPPPPPHFQLVGHSAAISSLSFSADSCLLASVAAGDDRLRVWDVSSREEWCRVSVPAAGACRSVCFVPSAARGAPPVLSVGLGSQTLLYELHRWDHSDPNSVGAYRLPPPPTTEELAAEAAWTADWTLDSVFRRSVAAGLTTERAVAHMRAQIEAGAADPVQLRQVLGDRLHRLVQ